METATSEDLNNAQRQKQVDNITWLLSELNKHFNSSNPCRADRNPARNLPHEIRMVKEAASVGIEPPFELKLQNAAYHVQKTSKPANSREKFCWFAYKKS